MRALARKNYASQSNPNVGYIEPLLVYIDGDWVAATNQIIPKFGRVWVWTSYNDTIDTKFSEGEVFETILEELEDSKKGDCEYSTKPNVPVVQVSQDLAFHTVFNFWGVINPNRTFQTQSKIKPTRYSFFVGDDLDKGRVLVGPMELVNNTFDPSTQKWDCTFKPMPAVHAAKFGLDAWELYFCPLAIVPDGALFTLDDASGSDQIAYLSLGLPNLLNSINAETVQFMDDETLLKLFDEALPDTKKLGRSGRRDLLKQISSVSRLSATQKDRVQSLLTKHEERYASLIPAVAEDNQQSLASAQDTKELEAKNEEIRKLRQDLSDERRRSAMMEDQLNRQEQAGQNNDKVPRLEAELDEFKKK